MSPIILQASWLIIAVIFAVIEIKTFSFGFIFVTVSAIAAGILAIAQVDFVYQLIVFSSVLLLSFVFLRPFFIRHFKKSNDNYRFLSRADRLIGHKGLVTEFIDQTTGRGRILIEGEDWAATSPIDIVPNTEVLVESSDGIVLNVKVI